MSRRMDEIPLAQDLAMIAGWFAGTVGLFLLPRLWRKKAPC